jgi:hypothetical protein
MFSIFGAGREKLLRCRRPGFFSGRVKMRRSRHRYCFAIALAVSPVRLWGADNHYIAAGAGNWQDPDKWSLGAPSSSDSNDYLDWPAGSSVLISSSTTSSFPSTLSINNLFVQGPSLLTIDSSASAAVPLNVSVEFIVDTGGTFNLSGGAVSTATFDSGYYGAGTTTQAGGSLTTTGDLHVGRQVGGNGSYTLNSGTLSVGSAEYVGEAFTTANAVGVFVQNGGTHTIANGLNVGNQDAGSGAFTLAGGTLTVTDGIVVGDVGTFTQTGGTINLQNGGGYGTLQITGSYTLSQPNAANPASLTVPNTEYIGQSSGSPPGSVGYFTQNGGTHTITGNLTMARNVGSNAVYTLNGGTLTANNCYIAGDTSDAGGTATLNINGGTATIGTGGGTVHIYGGGTFNINPGGTLVTNTLINDGQITNNGGNLQYNGTVTGTGGIDNNTGNTTFSDGSAVDTQDVTIAGGTATDPGSLLVGHTNGATGILNVTGGTTTIAATLGVGNTGAIAGSGGTGMINISGGTLSAGTILLGSTNGGSGTMVIGGTAMVNVAGGFSSNDVIANGGTLTIGTTPPAGEDPELFQAIVGGYLRNGAISNNGSIISTPYMKLGITAGYTGTYTQTAGTTLITTALCVGCDVNQSSGAGTGVVNIFGGTTTAATLLVGSTAGGVGSVTVGGGSTPGTLVVSGPIDVLSGNALAVTTNGLLKLSAHGTAYNASSISGLAVTGGTFDITNNAIDLPYAAGSSSNPSLSTIVALVEQGCANGTWTGTGITSSTAAADPLHLTAVAVIVNNDGSGNELYYNSSTGLTNPPDPKKLGLFQGDSPGLNDVLVAQTYYGDANLDGKIDGSDYSLIDNGYAKHLTGWYSGDFNYDGVVDGSDYALIDNAFNNQGAGFSPSALTASVTALPSVVPEPTGFGLLTGSVFLITGRRRRRTSRRSGSQYSTVKST